MTTLTHQMANAEPACVSRLRYAARRAAARAGFSDRTQDDVALAVTEAVTNVVLHAYGKHHEWRPLHFGTSFTDGVLTIVCRDNGQGCSPRPDSPGMGAGLVLIRAVCPRAEVSAPPGGGTCVLLPFVASDEPVLATGSR